jgi:hypothetical protein
MTFGILDFVDADGVDLAIAAAWTLGRVRGWGGKKICRRARSWWPASGFFLEHLVSSDLSPKTIQKHVDNMWVLGGEIIRDLTRHLR